MYATASEYLFHKYPKSSLLENPNISLNSQYYPVENFEETNISIPHIEMKYKNDLVSTSDPKIWGPPFWFSLHVSAVYYPENPSQIVRDRMKQRIMAIPYEVPCGTCRPHASSFIESYREKLDQVVSNKHELGKFYVDFHNNVNRRYNKPEWTYEQAYKIYSGQAKITYLT